MPDDARRIDVIRTALWQEPQHVAARGSRGWVDIGTLVDRKIDEIAKQVLDLDAAIESGRVRLTEPR